MTQASKFIRWLLRSLAVLVVIVIAAFVVWRVNLAHDVNVKLQVIRAAGLPTSGAELNAYYPAVPDNENAALVMTQAFALLHNFPDRRSNEIANFKIPLRGQVLTDEQKQLLGDYIAVNADALTKDAEAIKLPNSRYSIDFSPGFNTLLAHLGQIKKLALLSEYKALLATNSDQLMDADASVANILGTARTLDEEPTLISQLVRFALDNIAVTTLEHRLNAGSLNEVELSNLSGAFARQENTNLITRALVGERAMAIPCFRMSLAEIRKLSQNDEDGKNPPAGPPLPGPQPVLFQVTGFLERDLHVYLQAMETNIFFAKLPPPQNFVITNVSHKMAEDALAHYCILSAMFLPGLSGAIMREADNFARLRLATTAIAVERFRLAHGQLPENLNDLVPQFLSEIPADPFDGQLLRYHRLAKGYVIYSVGSDGHDDGGREKPADWKSSDKTTCDITFTVER